MEQQKQVIQTYLQRHNTANNYALLLNGKWGTGKTYYFKKVLAKEISETSKFKVLYLSLNGISKVEDVINTVLITKSNFDGFGKWFGLENNHKSDIWQDQVAQQLITWGSAALEKLKGGYFDAHKEKNFKQNLQKLANFEEYLVCFDDLERCTIPIAELMGFINSHFVEHNQIKTIIIADESEIKDKETYQKIKEKLIGRTIDFQPNQKEIVDSILKEKEMAFLLPHREFIDTTLEAIDNSWNLRTLFFAFDNLAQLKTSEYFSEQIIQTFSKYSNDNLFHQWIFYTLAASYEFKHDFAGEFKYLKNLAFEPESDTSTDSYNGFDKPSSSKSVPKISKYQNAILKDFFPNHADLRDYIYSFILCGALKTIDIPSVINEEIKRLEVAVKYAEFQKLRSQFFSAAREPISEEEVCAAVRSVEQMMNFSMIESGGSWYLPIHFLLRMKKMQENGFLENFLEIREMDIEEYYLQKDCYVNFLQKNEGYFAKNTTELMANIHIDIHEYVVVDEIKTALEYVAKMNEVWVSNNEYLSYVKEIYDKIKELRQQKLTTEYWVSIVVFPSRNVDDLAKLTVDDLQKTLGLVVATKSSPMEGNRWDLFVKSCQELSSKQQTPLLVLLAGNLKTALKNLLSNEQDKVIKFRINQALAALDNQP